MVYRGKPSTACGECRKRRSRCDESLPACGQCIKAKRICPGYRNLADLLFCDESSNVVQKNQEKSASSAHLALAVQGRSRTSNNRASQQARPIQLTGFVMCQPLNQLAVNFFMDHYVGNDPSTSQFDYLPSFYLRNAFPNPELQHSIEAIGLAGYAKASRRSDIVLPATKSYISAIREVKNALSSDVSATQDSTLISVMLLAMFEVMILPRASGLQNLTKHLNGAISIASLRLKQGIHTNIGRRLMSTLVQSTIMNCWMQNISLPVDFVAFKNYLGGKSNPASIHANFLDIVMDLIQFRHGLSSGAQNSPTTIISEAVALDVRFHTFGEHMSTSEQSKKYHSPLEAEELVYNGHYHIYPHIFAAHLWNSVRLCRVRLHLIILTQCHTMKSSRMEFISMPAQISESENTIRELSTEICASVPQLSGYLEWLRSYCQSDKENLPCDLHELAGKTSTSIPLSTHFIYDPSPFENHQHKHSNSASSNPATLTTPLLKPRFLAPRPQSLYHMLYQLHALYKIKLIPSVQRNWMLGRIQWMEANADPEGLLQLKEMLESKPENGTQYLSTITAW